jgi:cytoskeletal protein CcmA (bactofilin family)
MSFWKTPPVDKPTEPEVTSSSTKIGADSPLEVYGKVKSMFGSGTSIQGKLSFETSVRIDGNLSGEVTSTQALLVGKGGRIEAKIDTRVLAVEGVVKGPVVAKEKIEIFPGGVIEGDISTPILVVHEGSAFDGKCSMPGSKH